MGYLEWITDTRKASITARLQQVEGEGGDKEGRGGWREG